MPDNYFVPTPSRCHCEEERRSNPEEGKGRLRNRRKTIAQIFPLRIHLRRHSGVERAVSFVGEDIDVVALADDDPVSDSGPQVSSGSSQSHGSLRRASSR